MHTINRILHQNELLMITIYITSQTINSLSRHTIINSGMQLRKSKPPYPITRGSRPATGARAPRFLKRLRIRGIA